MTSIKGWVKLQINTRKNLIAFFNKVMKQIHDAKIIGIEIAACTVKSLFPYNYFTDGDIHILFDNGSMLCFSNPFYSIGTYELKKITFCGPFFEKISSFNGLKIIDFEINFFSEEYEINPASGETRPAGGDYYKEIFLYTEKQKMIGIVALDSLYDGWTNLFFCGPAYFKSEKKWKSFINQEVHVIINSPKGSIHPKYKDIVFPINYGYTFNETDKKRKKINCYVLGIDHPLKEFHGVIIAVIYTFYNRKVKFIVAQKGVKYSKKEIFEAIYFQEQFCIFKLIQ